MSDLNLRPKDYESSALTAELMARIAWEEYYHKIVSLVKIPHWGSRRI